MSKRNLLWLILDSILLIVFNLIFFSIVGTVNPVSVWVSYGAITLSYLCFLSSSLFSEKSTVEADIRRPVYLFTALHFMVCLLAGGIIIYLRPDRYVPTVLLFAVLFGLAAIIILSLSVAGNHTAESIRKQESDAQFINSSRRLKLLLSDISDPKLLRRITNLYDLWLASPRGSSVEAHSIEVSIVNMVAELEESCDAGNTEDAMTICEHLTQKIKRRNLILKQV